MFNHHSYLAEREKRNQPENKNGRFTNEGMTNSVSKGNEDNEKIEIPIL